MSTPSASEPHRATSERLIAPPEEGESLVQHGVRSTKNFFTACFGCIQTSDEKAKIRYYQYLIESRKKAFGVEYVNLLKSQASQADLDACVAKCLKDIARIDEDIVELNAEVEKVTGETKSKIVKSPAKSGATATAATSTTAAAGGSAPAAASAAPSNLPAEVAAPATSSAPATVATAPAAAAAAPPAEETTTSAATATVAEPASS